MKDAFYSFPVGDASDFSDKTVDLVKLIKSVMADSGKDAMFARLNKIATTAATSGGIAKLCNSYFYRRNGFPDCDYQLNKEGAESIFNQELSKIDCGKDDKGNNNGTAVADITNSKGYICVCNEKTKNINGFCVSCIPDGTVSTCKSPYFGNRSYCG